MVTKFLNLPTELLFSIWRLLPLEDVLVSRAVSPECAEIGNTVLSKDFKVDLQEFLQSIPVLQQKNYELLNPPGQMHTPLRDDYVDLREHRSQIIEYIEQRAVLSSSFAIAVAFYYPACKELLLSPLLLIADEPRNQPVRQYILNRASAVALSTWSKIPNNYMLNIIKRLKQYDAQLDLSDLDTALSASLKFITIYNHSSPDFILEQFPSIESLLNWGAKPNQDELNQTISILQRTHPAAGRELAALFILKPDDYTITLRGSR